MKDIEKLQDGQKGIVFKVTADDGTQKVIKLQQENPSRAVVGTALLMQAGVNTAAILPVKDEKLGQLQQDVQAYLDANEGSDVDLSAAQQLTQALAAVSNPAASPAFGNVVEMDFVRGRDLQKAVQEPDFKQLLTNPSFQRQLGQIMAADAFTGNPDRFAARADTGANPGDSVKGWYNQNNLIIEGRGDDVQLKAIDNDFRPGANVDSENVFGGAAHGGQWGSVAAANSQQFKREVFAVIERLETEANVRLSPQEIKDFITQATEGAQETMDTLLAADITPERVDQMLDVAGEAGRSKRECVQNFSKHVQMIQLLRDDLQKSLAVKPTVAEMAGIASAKGPLTMEKVLEGLGVSKEDAAEIAQSREKLDRFNKLMQGEKGAHVPKDFKITTREAAAMAKDESTYKQFTQKAGGPKV